MTDLNKILVGKLAINTFYDAKSRSSFCWKYFGNLVVTEDGKKKKIVNSDHVYCLACLSVVKEESEEVTFGSVKIKCYNKTVSTGNLTRHLRDDHQIQDIVGNVNKLKTKIEDVFTVAWPICSTSSAISSTHDKSLLARDMALWFCKSLIPFDSVSDEGMVDFFKKYNIIANDDDIPSRNTISGSALSDVYESMLNKVKENIVQDAASHFAVTFDLWTDQYRRLNYITFKLHYFTSDFVLKAFTLSTEIMYGEKTCQKIKDAINNIRNKFGLNDKNMTAVTEARGNVKVSLTDMCHHLCLGHGLHNLVTVDGINSVPEIADLIKKFKNIFKALRYQASESQTDTKNIKAHLNFLLSMDRVVELIEIDESDPILDEEPDQASPSVLNSPEHIQTVQTATPTRWHIVLEMLESVMHFRNQEPINDMLRKIGQDELKITQSEWILLNNIVKFLRSFREAVEIMSSQKTCTMNIALVFRSEIIDVLNTIQDDESLILLQLKSNMLANIDKRFPVTKTMVAAALLDTRFMSLNEINIYLEKINTTRTGFLAAYVKEIINYTPDTLNVPSSSSNGKNNISLLQKLSKKHSFNPCQDKDQPIDQECWRYIAAADPMEPKDGDLLAYWNSRKEAFPNLSVLAKALLCIPVTSTQSERVFSVAGLAFTAKRSRLNPIRVNKIIFIHDNYKACKM